MKIKLIGKGHYEVFYKDKPIGKFDRYDLEILDNVKIGSSIIFNE